jgi:hypothetical protein
MVRMTINLWTGQVCQMETTLAAARCELGSYEIYFIKIGLFARPAG